MALAVLAARPGLSPQPRLLGLLGLLGLGRRQRLAHLEDLSHRPGLPDLQARPDPEGLLALLHLRCQGREDRPLPSARRDRLGQLDRPGPRAQQLPRGARPP